MIGLSYTKYLEMRKNYHKMILETLSSEIEISSNAKSIWNYLFARADKVTGLVDYDVDDLCGYFGLQPKKLGAYIIELCQSDWMGIMTRGISEEILELALGTPEDVNKQLHDYKCGVGFPIFSSIRNPANQSYIS